MHCPLRQRTRVVVSLLEEDMLAFGDPLDKGTIALTKVGLELRKN